MLVHRVETFVGDGGQMVEEWQLVDSETKEAATEEQMQAILDQAIAEGIEGAEEAEMRQTAYLGFVKMALPGPMAPNGEPLFVQHRDVRFPINAPNLEGAFDDFGSSFEAFMKEQEKMAKDAMEKRKNKLIVPDAASSEAINNSNVVADGGIPNLRISQD